MNLVDQITSIGVENITTDEQKKNGTIMFYDPLVKCFYASYKKGYIRRTFHSRNPKQKYSTGYQLNKTEKYINRWGREATRRIMIDSEVERLNKLFTSIKKYRVKKLNPDYWDYLVFTQNTKTI